MTRTRGRCSVAITVSRRHRILDFRTVGSWRLSRNRKSNGTGRSKERLRCRVSSKPRRSLSLGRLSRRLQPNISLEGHRGCDLRPARSRRPRWVGSPTASRVIAWRLHRATEVPPANRWAVEMICGGGGSPRAETGSGEARQQRLRTRASRTRAVSDTPRSRSLLASTCQPARDVFPRSRGWRETRATLRRIVPETLSEKGLGGQVGRTTRSRDR